MKHVKEKTILGNACLFSIVFFLALLPIAVSGDEGAPLLYASPTLAPDFDIRASLSTPVREVSPEQIAAFSVLKATNPRIEVKWSPKTGSPVRLFSYQQPLTMASTLPKSEIAMQFINNNLELFNLSLQDISDVITQRQFVTAHNNIAHLTLQQRVNGIKVFGAKIKMNIDAEGRILNIGGEFIPGLYGAAGSSVPTFSAEQAMAAAVTSAGLTSAKQLGDAELVYFPLSGDEAPLGWELTIEDSNSPEMYQVVVDAQSNAVLWRHSLTRYAHGSVFISDSPDPDTPTGTTACTPTATYPDCAEDRMDVNFDGSAFFSLGDNHYDWWHDSTGSADTATTKSNNVHAKEDQDSDNDDTEGFPTVAGGDFTFVMDLSQDPTTEDASVQNQSSSIINAFYWINHIHDIYYHYGFDEASGNFQSDNFTLGGLGNDPVQADVQDSAKNCNAGFSTPGDGSSPRMSLYLCNNAAPHRDSGMENLIIIHEYTHGLSHRLADFGPYHSQSGGLQDGLCDFMGLAITSEEGDDLTASYPRGQWFYNNVNGNRRQPYSTDQTIFTRTYANLSDNPDPWPAGEIWCNTLWNARANLVWKHGFATGGDTIMQLAVDGLKNAPPNPDYLDMRDAILLADNVNSGGVNRCILWNAFARMGMGYSATSTGETDINPVEAFDVPTDCVADISVSTDFSIEGVCLGATADNLFQITNTGSGDLIVRNIERISGSADISIVPPFTVPLVIEPATSVDLTVRCAPTSSGERTTTFRITSDDPDEGTVDLVYTCGTDVTPPNFTATPPDVNVECDQSTDPSATGTPTVVDNCGGSLSLSFIDEVTPGTCPQESTISRTWATTDVCGNDSSYLQTIRVVDTTAPVISCNAPGTITPPDAPISFTASAVDNCDDSPRESIVNYNCYQEKKNAKIIDKTESCVVSINGSTVSILDSGGVGTHITWTVHSEDSCGNASTGQCEVMVELPSSNRKALSGHP